MTSLSKGTIGKVVMLLGLILTLCSHVALKNFSQAHTDNYLAPAGQFFPGKSSFSFIVPSPGQKIRGGSDAFRYLAASVNADGTLAVREVSVTKKQGREHLKRFLSTGMPRFPAGEIGLILIIGGFWLFAASKAGFSGGSVSGSDSA